MGYLQNIEYEKNKIPGFISYNGSGSSGVLLTETKNFSYRWTIYPNVNNCGAMYIYGMKPISQIGTVEPLDEDKKEEIAKHFNSLCESIGKITNFWNIQFSYSYPQEKNSLTLLPNYLKNAVFVKGRSNDRAEYSTFVTVTTGV